MQRGEADIALNAFIVTKDRSDIGNYLSFDDDEYGLIYITNPKDTFDWKVYTKQYRTEAWIGFWLFILTVPLLLKIILVEWRYGKMVTSSLFDGYVSLFNSVLLLGLRTQPESLRGMISCFSIMIFGMLFYWLWEAELISYFSVPVKKLPFNNLEEFITKTDKKLLLLKGSMPDAQFRHSKDKIMQTVWNERIQPYLDNPLYEKRYCDWFDEMVKDDSYAAYIITHKTGPMHCAQFAKCNIISVPFVVTKSSGTGWVFPKNSFLFSLFKHHVSLMKENGIYNRIKASYNDELNPGQVCPDLHGEAIGLNKCFSLFALVYSGVALSIVVLV